MTIPRGDTGAAGPKGDTGAAGPKGDTGATGPVGPANTLTIGTVTTGAAGSSASATVTGAAPNQTLNLTIPRGDTGAADVLPMVRGLVGYSSSQTALRFACDHALMATAIGGSAKAFGAIADDAAVDISVAGPAAGGRDRASAFPNGSTLHFYFIGTDAGGVSRTVSLKAPSEGGPTLPSGYTRWAYVASIVMRSGNLCSSYGLTLRGHSVFFNGPMQSGDCQVLSSGAATSYTDVSVGALVPANSTTVKFFSLLQNSGSTYVGAYISLNASNYLHHQLFSYGGVSSGGEFNVPQVSQKIRYSVSDGSAGSLLLWVRGYTVPNGDC